MLSPRFILQHGKVIILDCYCMSLMTSVCGLLLLAAAVDLQEAEPVGNAFLMECAHDILACVGV